MTVTVAGLTENLRTGTTDPWTWSSFNAASPQGAVVAIAHGTESTDLVVSVTYGGVTMQRIQTNVDTATEAGRSYLYFLGAGLTAGVQTISVDLASATTTDLFGLCWVLDGAADLSVADQDGRDNNAGADPTELTLQYGGKTCMAFAVCYSGVTANTTLTVNGNMTKDSTTDLAGNFTCGVGRQTTAGSSDFAIGFGGVGTDDLALSVVAITEVFTTTLTAAKATISFTAKDATFSETIALTAAKSSMAFTPKDAIFEEIAGAVEIPYLVTAPYAQP